MNKGTKTWKKATKKNRKRTEKTINKIIKNLSKSTLETLWQLCKDYSPSSTKNFNSHRTDSLKFTMSKALHNNSHLSNLLTLHKKLKISNKIYKTLKTSESQITLSKHFLHLFMMKIFKSEKLPSIALESSDYQKPNKLLNTYTSHFMIKKARSELWLHGAAEESERHSL